MLKTKDLPEAGKGLADKGLGLVYEIAGTLAGNERLTQSGRDRQQAGTERLMALEEEAKASSRATEAEINEARQRSHQPPEDRSRGRTYGEQASITSAAAERAKAGVKKGFAVVTGDEELEAEADAQRDKAEAQGQAAKHEVKAEAHRRKADAASREAERDRRSS